MKLHNQDVQKLFSLAKLSTKKVEEDSLTRDLSSVLSWMEILQGANTENILPMTHPVLLNINFNDDLPPENISLDNALKNAPESECNHFLVPKVIDQV